MRAKQARDERDNPMTKTIETTKDTAQAINWVNKTVSKDDARPVLETVNTNGHLLSADGHRLHAANVKLDLEPGLYTYKTVGTTVIATESELTPSNYPNTDVIIPKGIRYVEIAINPKYLADALSGMDNMARIFIQVKEDETQSVIHVTQPIQVFGHTKDDTELYALVMPMHDTNHELGWQPLSK
jgi:hypothetical protein